MDWVDIPEDYINATLAAEDKRFFSHGGLDLIALSRAMKSNISVGRIVSGASTISQQLVKISSPRGDRDVWVKFREFFQARHLEMTHTKKEILTEYFNRLDYGNLREGPVAAARFYFGKPLKELSLAESALLVSLPQSPSRLNPLKHPERALKRRNWVLERMAVEFGYSRERIERAKEEPLVFHEESSGIVAAPHLMSMLLWRGVSGEIRTTLDGKLQMEAQRIVAREMDLLKSKGVSQAAVLVVDNESGHILTWVGSANRRDPSGGLMDGVLVPRSAGSTLKPFVYELAFRKGVWAGSVFPDIPTRYMSADGVDAPRNFNNRYRGPMTVREALACSQNIPAMRALGLGGGAADFLSHLKELGFEALQGKASDYGLGLAIGNAEVRLLDTVRAYVTLARGGESISLQLCPESSDILGVRPSQRLIPEQHAYVITDILADKNARIGGFGMRSPLNLPFPCAVKTGTSSDFRDNWCVGYTKAYTVGVWVGNFDNRRMEGVSGISGAGPMFAGIMKYLHDGGKSEWFSRPQGLVRVEIDKRSGKDCSQLSGIPDQFKYEEWAFASHPPVKAKESDYDEKGRYILSSLYSEWYESAENNSKDAYTIRNKSWSADEKPRILNPVPGALLLLDPELPGGGRLIPLRSNLPEGVVWECSTLNIIQRNGRYILELMPGRHTVKALHPETGLESESTITVKSL